MSELPFKPTYHFHWLALQGLQPLIPENAAEVPIPTPINTASGSQLVASFSSAKALDSRPKPSHLPSKPDEITKASYPDVTTY